MKHQQSSRQPATKFAHLRKKMQLGQTRAKVDARPIQRKVRGKPGTQP
jgi:hypothetical protein